MGRFDFSDPVRRGQRALARVGRPTPEGQLSDEERRRLEKRLDAVRLMVKTAPAAPQPSPARRSPANPRLVDEAMITLAARPGLIRARDLQRIRAWNGRASRIFSRSAVPGSCDKLGEINLARLSCRRLR